MPTTITREALHQRVWETPLSRLAPEWSTTPQLLAALCDQAGVARPSSAYWTLLQMGRPQPKAPLDPAPDGIANTLTIPEPNHRRARDASATRDEMEAGAADPSSSESPSPNLDEAEEAGPIDAASQTPPVDEAPPRPTAPTVLTREALYEAVWQMPMSRLAAAYGVSGNGLAKICDRADIPYPTRGYWAKVLAGQAPERTALPPVKGAGTICITIRPTPAPLPQPELPAELQADFAASQAQAKAFRICARHPVTRIR